MPYARPAGGGNDVDAEALEPDAQVVDNYEVGWRAWFQHWQASVSAFYATTGLGTTFGGPPDFEQNRQKEETYGVELSADVDATRAVRLGGTASWQEGRTDTDDDGDTDSYLPGTRIAPPELTLYGEYAPTELWSARLQAKHLFKRDRFADNATGFGKGGFDDGYTLLDLSARAEVGPGTLSVGIDNLLDEQYITQLG